MEEFFSQLAKKLILYFVNSVANQSFPLKLCLFHRPSVENFLLFFPKQGSL